MIGFPKSARLSMATRRKAFAIPGRASGQITVRRMYHLEAPRVSAASSRLTSSACTTPCSTRYAIGAYARIWANATPTGPKNTLVDKPKT